MLNREWFFFLNIAAVNAKNQPFCKMNRGKMSRFASEAILIPMILRTLVWASGVRSPRNISGSAMPGDLDLLDSFDLIYAAAVLAFILHSLGTHISEGLGIQAAAFRASHSQCSLNSNSQPQPLHSYFVMVNPRSSSRSSRNVRSNSAWAWHSGHLVMSAPP